METRDCTYQGLDAEEAFSGGAEINNDGTCHPLMVGRRQILSKESVFKHEHEPAVRTISCRWVSAFLQLFLADKDRLMTD